MKFKIWNCYKHLSVVQLNNLEFVLELEDLLNTNQLSTKNIKLDITESVIVIDEMVMKSSLKSLLSLGAILSLDNFGTESSYGYLKIPVWCS